MKTDIYNMQQGYEKQVLEVNRLVLKTKGKFKFTIQLYNKENATPRVFIENVATINYASYIKPILIQQNRRSSDTQKIITTQIKLQLD